MYKYKNVKQLQMFGSRVVCDPPPTDTDEDWIAYTDDLEALKDELRSDGYEIDRKKDYGMRFYSYRKGIINLIVTTDIKFYDATVKATQIAKDLNLMSKKDRKNLFFIVYSSYGIEV